MSHEDPFSIGCSILKWSVRIKAENKTEKIIISTIYTAASIDFESVIPNNLNITSAVQIAKSEIIYNRNPIYKTYPIK